MSVGVQRLRDEPDRIRQGAIDKGEDPALVDRAIEVDRRRRALQAESDAKKAERNTVSKQIGEAIRGGAKPDGDEVRALRDQSTAAGARIDAIDAELAQAEQELEDLLLRIPNPADPEVPVGGEEANQTVRTWGDPHAHEETAADGTRWARRPHWEIGEALDIIDNPRGAKVAGSGFPVYKGLGSRLQRGLISWFLDVHTTEHGFTEVWPPAVVNAASARGTGQIPDKEDQMYVVTRDDLYLVPTAEVPVTNLHRDEILDAAELPIRYAAYTPCFRREAGAAGKDTRGILRVHQFDKVEMVLFEKPEDSPQALEWMTRRAEVLLQRLGLPYRVLLMSTGEMGFVQRKKYDLEVWAPGVERWLEVSSCSNFGDYQARRMAIRYRPEKGAKPELVHTLNGSGLALARIVAAILEVYQQADGSVTVPEVLRPYLRTDTMNTMATA
jgi:seryl-tRNA synthetase